MQDITLGLAERLEVGLGQLHVILHTWKVMVNCSISLEQEVQRSLDFLVGRRPPTKCLVSSSGISHLARLSSLELSSVSSLQPYNSEKQNTAFLFPNTRLLHCFLSTNCFWKPGHMLLILCFELNPNTGWDIILPPFAILPLFAAFWETKYDVN